MARIVVPGVAHHVMRRGNRGQPTFFNDEDYRAYLRLMGKYCARFRVDIWAYCLMPTHVHMIAVPKQEDSLRAALGEAHRRYTRAFNRRQGWRGHLWLERFHSFPVDEGHLLDCARYVVSDPVRAKLVARPEDWAWSSVRAHLAATRDGAVNVAPLLQRVADWPAFLDSGLTDRQLSEFRRHSRTGRPLGSPGFVDKLEGLAGRSLKRGKPGPRVKDVPDDAGVLIIK